MTRPIPEIEADLAACRAPLDGAHHDIAAHLEALRSGSAPAVRGSMAAAFESQRQWGAALRRYRAELEAHPEFELDLFAEMFPA